MRGHTINAKRPDHPHKYNLISIAKSGSFCFFEEVCAGAGVAHHPAQTASKKQKLWEMTVQAVKITFAGRGFENAFVGQLLGTKNAGPDQAKTFWPDSTSPAPRPTGVKKIRGVKHVNPGGCFQVAAHVRCSTAE